MTAKRSNGASKAPESLFPFTAMMPAASSFLASQRIALEAARFWARRMRAYADQSFDVEGLRLGRWLESLLHETRHGI